MIQGLPADCSLPHYVFDAYRLVGAANPPQATAWAMAGVLEVLYSGARTKEQVEAALVAAVADSISRVADFREQSPPGSARGTCDLSLDDMGASDMDVDWEESRERYHTPRGSDRDSRASSEGAHLRTPDRPDDAS